MKYFFLLIMILWAGELWVYDENRQTVFRCYPMNAEKYWCEPVGERP